MHNKCECVLAGYCNRHKMNKTQSMVDSCKRNPDMFLHFEMQANNIRTPNIIDKAVNYVAAEVKHTVTGRKEASEETFNKRLKICEECPLFDAVGVTCQHQDCGCYLKIKAKWDDSEYPVGKWEVNNGNKQGPCKSCGSN